MAKYTYVILFSFVVFQLQSQISPGKLSNSHSDLEGISNCTLCHELGNKVLSSKCLDCHQEINDLINDERGYHSNYEVTSKECFDCHSEHHGRNFDMLHFDENEFDHDLSGYVLEDTHLAIDCRDCHKPDFISNTDIKNREETYLGLTQDCLSCHSDYHQETLSSDCISCHDFDKFRPAPRFDHTESAFTLEGKHVDVECIECHEKTVINGDEFQVFSGLKFDECTSCHEDAHQGNLNSKCTNCHNEESFTSQSGLLNFNHSSTEFTLKGSHRRTTCFDCHSKSSNPLLLFQDFNEQDINSCATCHDDVHEGKFGNECSKCHQETKFSDLKSMDFFNHQLTDYHLEGLHVNIECKSCHTESYIEPIDYSTCNKCHDDYHNGEFETNGLSKDCKECHTVFEPFEYTLFSIEDHEKTNFPLDGAHLATPCFECHVSEDKWEFRSIGSACVDCHKDIHQGFISEKYYPEQNCNSCHITEDWKTVTFEHQNTEWPLEGAHKATKCRECHFDIENESANLTQIFENLDHSCITCHENVHKDQFENNGITDCTRCHDSETWYPSIFNHNETAFPLDGKHADLECVACHLRDETDINNIIVQYKIEKFECVDCHS